MGLDWKTIRTHRYLIKGIKWLRNAIVAFLVLSVAGVIVFRWVAIPFTWLMVDRMLDQKWNGKPVVVQKEWVPLAQISDHLILAVVCSEDINFEDHRGFDFEAIEKVIEQNKKLKKKGKPIKGASTITQQVAKNVFLWPSRSWLRKAFEVYFTVLIEVFWSKERIMEVYLNVIEMGDGIYGAQAASYIYFGKKAADLKPGEAALIAAVLPNPRKWSPRYPDSYIQKKKNRIMNLMIKWGGSLDLNY